MLTETSLEGLNRRGCLEEWGTCLSLAPSPSSVTKSKAELRLADAGWEWEQGEVGQGQSMSGVIGRLLPWGAMGRKTCETPWGGSFLLSQEGLRRLGWVLASKNDPLPPLAEPRDRK